MDEDWIFADLLRPLNQNSTEENGDSDSDDGDVNEDDGPTESTPTTASIDFPGLGSFRVLPRASLELNGSNSGVDSAKAAKIPIEQYLKLNRIPVSSNLESRESSAKYPLINRYQRPAYDADVLDVLDYVGCENDVQILALARDVYGQAACAEIGVDDGVPLDAKDIRRCLPRSFLLDYIHRAAANHCLYRHRKAGRSTDRSDCPSPVNRLMSAGCGDRKFQRKMKALVLKNRRKMIEVINFEVLRSERIEEGTESGSEEASDSDTCSANEGDSDGSDEESANGSNRDLVSSCDSVSSVSAEELGVDHQQIISDLLKLNRPLAVPDAYIYEDLSDFGADALWALDPSALLAFGVLGEEFMRGMLKDHADVPMDHESTDEESGVAPPCEEDFDSWNEFEGDDGDGRDAADDGDNEADRKRPRADDVPMQKAPTEAPTDGSDNH